MLIDAYDAVSTSPRLAQVRIKAFGDASELDQVAANPRMIWVPTEDRYAPPDTLGHQKGLIVEGKRVEATSILLRKAGCAIHLFTDYGPDGHRQMEHLLNELIVALHEELLSFGNFDLGDPTWFPRGALSQKAIEVQQPLRVYVPVARTQPAQVVGAARTRLV